MSKNIIGYVAALTLIVAAGSASAADLTPKEKLGKNLFFDMQLSTPAGQSCASCHSPGAGFNGAGDASIAVHEGAVVGRFGKRNPPSAAYASFSPTFHYDDSEGLYIGGQFWDGRAATLADQAKGPFLNPVEQNNAAMKDVVKQVKNSNYVELFVQVYGANVFGGVEKAYDSIADAIAAYESSAEVNRFTSKFDWYLSDPSKFPLSAQESMGLALFNNPLKGNCSACHPSTPGPYADKALFTDFSYDNIGAPKNGDYEGQDLGLGVTVNNVMENGKFKVPTLRNVGVSPPYAHNGYFKTLKEIVHFYNTRDVPCDSGTGGGMGGGGMGGGGMGGGGMGGGMCDNWPLPEVTDTVNRDELGNLRLTSGQEDAIVAFLMTLTDGYAPPHPR